MSADLRIESPVAFSVELVVYYDGDVFKRGFKVFREIYDGNWVHGSGSVNTVAHLGYIILCWTKCLQVASYSHRRTNLLPSVFLSAQSSEK